MATPDNLLIWVTVFSIVSLLIGPIAWSWISVRDWMQDRRAGVSAGPPFRLLEREEPYPTPEEEETRRAA